MPDRRDFMIQTGVAAGAVVLQAQPAGGAPAWVRGVTRMTFGSPGEVERAAKAGAQVFHTNLVWPYFPLRRDRGGLSADDSRKLSELVAACQARDMRIILGLPPFPSVEHVRKHPDWRVKPSPTATSPEPKAGDLGGRIGCNVGPWGHYLIDLCGELIEDFEFDGFSFDGNYHPPLCHCSSCSAAYCTERGCDLPAKVNFDDFAYREYLVWRGEKLEGHYRKLRERIRKAKPDAVLMSWTVNAGRYGHFLYSPRAMPTSMNRLFDLPMQEWWLDESNVGASVAPAFGVAYLRAVAGDGPCAAEPYLMTRGRPATSDSLPAHERRTRAFLALTHGGVLALSLGWPGHDPAPDFREVEKRSPYLTDTKSMPWAAMLVSEQTRQFWCYKDIARRFLPPVFGTFRAALEEHLPMTLVNDWDLDAKLARFAVLMLPASAALSKAQVSAVRDFVRGSGGLVVSGETSLADEFGRPRDDFALADVFGVSLRKQHDGVGTLAWNDHPLTRDSRLSELVPKRSAAFRGPWTQVDAKGEVIAQLKPEGAKEPFPAIVINQFGKGRVVYLAASIDAATWSYAYPYQRRLLTRALEWAAREAPPVRVDAPMCVQATYWTQGRRIVVHLFNGLNTAANHGDPATEVPLREETIPIVGIRVRFRGATPKNVRLEPGGRRVDINGDVLELPPLELHAMLVAEL
jgi:hypothetical protein